MLQTYRQIFSPATAAFSLTGLVARLPISMVGLGIVLLAEHETGSYGFAGSVSAVALIANALFAIPQGRLIDRLGTVGATSVAYLRVPTGVAIGVVFLGERLSPTAWAGLALVVIGVFAMTLPGRKSAS